MKKAGFLSAVALAASVTGGLVSGMAMIGTPVTLAKVLTLFFSGAGAGASLAVMIAGRRGK